MAYIDNHGKTTATRQLGKFVIPNNNKLPAVYGVFSIRRNEDRGYGKYKHRLSKP